MERPAGQPMFWIGGLGFMALPNLERGVTTLCLERGSPDSRRALGSVLAEDDLHKPARGEMMWSIGMTETFGPYAYGDVLRVAGYPLTSPLDHVAPGYEVRLWTEGREAKEGEHGEIQVRGYALTPGLHKVERDEFFEPDGFFRTGDMGVRDGARIHFLGRDGDMIKSASANVSPAEVELEMQQLDGIHSAYVVGIPDKERGQLVVAAVVPRDGVELDLVEVKAKLHQRLSSFKVPREYVVIGREDVPVLPTNKVARREIERLMIGRLGREMHMAVPLQAHERHRS
jgi:acyl-CoA synthetase (AMP-forming)/AMP-acid ligase II